MEKKIFIVSYSSYTTEDDYLYSNAVPYNDEKEARKAFKNGCKQAHDECEWGTQWDLPKNERDEELRYEVEENKRRNEYEVSSPAFDGYKVKVTIKEY